MKVLHIITGLNDGGAEAVLFRVCKHGNQFQHHVISMMGMGKYGDRLMELGVDVTCLGLSRKNISLKQLWRLHTVIKQEAPDVVQTWMYHADLLGGIIARVSGLRNICWGIRNTSLDRTITPKSTIIVAKLCALFSRFVPRHIICAANASLTAHVERGYDRDRMRVVNNGYDFSLFAPNERLRWEIRDSIGVGENEHLIGFVARFDKIKGHIHLLEALFLLREQGFAPKCLLVGTGLDGSNVEFYQEIVKRKLQDQIILHGPSLDIPGIMNALDVHVLPSLSEGFPNVLAEAMSCGTPCVTTNIGDASIIVGEVGLTVPVGHPQSLADAISSLLSERGSPEWQARSENCRERVMKHFSIESMIAGFEEVWTDCAKSQAENT